MNLSFKRFSSFSLILQRAMLLCFIDKEAFCSVIYKRSKIYKAVTHNIKELLETLASIYQFQ